MGRSTVLPMVLGIVVGCGSVTPPATPGAQGGGGTAAPAAGSREPSAPGSRSPAASTDGSGSMASGEPSTGVVPVATTGPAIEGTVTYVADDAAIESVDLAAASAGDASLSVADAAGRTWTLTIPEGAVSDPVTVTMRPLTEITLSGLPGPIGGGVLLDPPDIRFLESATLTVTGGDGKEVAILTGAADGSVSLVAPASDSLSTVGVTHFSPWYWIDPGDPHWSKYVEEVFDDGNAALAEAAAVLASPITPPAPPSLPYGCRDDATEKAAAEAQDAYVKAMRSPEVPLIQRLLAAEKIRGKIDPPTTWHPSILQLADRLVRKDMALLKSVKPRLDVLWPVLVAVIATGHDAGLVGSDTGPLTSALGAWASAALDSVVNGIVRDHDYKQVVDVLHVLRASALLGGGAPSLDEWLARLKRALAFDAVITWDVSSDTGERWRIEGAVPLSWAGPIWVKGVPFAKGSASITDVTHVPDESGTTLNWKPFPAQAAVLDVDVCKGTAWVGVDKFNLDVESYTDDTGETTPVALTTSFWTTALMTEHLSRNAGYVGTPVSLANGSETWIDETVSDPEDGWVSTFRFEVRHTGS